jgi:hypothetical protein
MTDIDRSTTEMESLVLTLRKLTREQSHVLS